MDYINKQAIGVRLFLITWLFIITYIHRPLGVAEGLLFVTWVGIVLSVNLNTEDDDEAHPSAFR